MINIRPEICYKIREARRLAKLGQVEVAKEVGCKQSALSMFEQGQPTKLSDEVVEKLAKKFNVELFSDTPTPQEISSVSAVKGYCPNPHCPSNHAYQVEGKTFYLPDLSAADPVGGRYCALCGEVLVRQCSNCHTEVHAGAVCSMCGEKYIAT